MNHDDYLKEDCLDRCYARAAAVSIERIKRLVRLNPTPVAVSVASHVLRIWKKEPLRQGGFRLLQLCIQFLLFRA